MNYGWTPRTSTSDCVIWRKREHNKEADFLANIAMDQMQHATYIWEGCNARRNEPHMLMGWSDGGHRFKGKSGGGWIIKAWFEEGPVPVVVAAGSEFYSDTDIDSYYAETLALTALMKKMDNLMRQGWIKTTDATYD